MRYEVGWITLLTTATANAPLCAIRAPATHVCRLLELGIFPDSAVSSGLGIVAATTVSVTPTGNIAGNNIAFGKPVSNTVIATGWGTAPVVGATPLYYREWDLAGTKGAGIILTWPADRPLEIGTGAAIGELVLCNMAALTIPAFRCYACFEE